MDDSVGMVMVAQFKLIFVSLIHLYNVNLVMFGTSNMAICYFWFKRMHRSISIVHAMPYDLGL